MASIIEGYTYDVFVSYRQKDNKYDGWVTEFVENLKKELEATFKEEISVYFDINPHNGLLETHDVDASLRDKLKCLIFIPVISHTYCDCASFAWNQELVPFLHLASNDRLGLKVMLKSGNVASRVLPVRIHDIDNEDLKLCESTLEGALRPIDFIYKSPGVNRPLRSLEDHPQDNLNRIYYRDQINKVANAIDEILGSLKKADQAGIHTNNIKQKEAINIPPAKPVTTDIPEIAAIKFPKQQSDAIDKKSLSEIILFSRSRLKKLQKYIFPVVFIASMIFLLFIWRHQLRLEGKDHVRREKVLGHIINAEKYIADSFYGPARSELDLALAIDSGSSLAWSDLAVVSIRLGNLNEAILQTIEAVKNNPSNPKAAYNLAFALEDKKDYHQSAEWYSKAIGIDSSLVPAYSALGRLYNQLNQPVDAILILTMARKKYPQSEYMYLINKNLGNSYFLMNNFDQATECLVRSLAIKPLEAETNMFMARTCEASGDLNRSIEAWQKYIDLETDTAKANQAKSHLKEITIKHLKEIIR
jgi:tetratricopeptide (TPR) repeat protein